MCNLSKKLKFVSTSFDRCVIDGLEEELNVKNSNKPAKMTKISPLTRKGRWGKGKRKWLGRGRAERESRCMRWAKNIMVKKRWKNRECVSTILRKINTFWRQFLTVTIKDLNNSECRIFSIFPPPPLQLTPPSFASKNNYLREDEEVNNYWKRNDFAYFSVFYQCFIRKQAKNVTLTI